MLREMLGLSVHEMSRIGGAVFAYLFHRIDQKKLIRIVNEYDSTKTEQILEVVRTKGYLLLNCKLYAWAFYKSRHGGPKPKPADFGIARADVQFLSRINLAHIPLKFVAYSVADFKNLIVEATDDPEIRAHIGRYVSKQLTFLVRNYGVNRNDLEGEMKAHAIRALYMKYPHFESVLHLRNNVKTTIHNRGQTLVSYHTSPARERLTKDAEGKFASRHVDTEALVDLEAPDEYMADVRDTLNSLVQISSALSLRQDVQRFLMCCAGHFDAGFSAFLTIDNAQAVEDMAYDKYLKKARTYFSFSEKQVTHLFAKLRTMLE